MSTQGKEGLVKGNLADIFDRPRVEMLSKDLDAEEPILQPQIRKGLRKYSLLPVEYPQLREFFMIGWKAIWSPHEVQYDTDIRHFNTLLDEDEKHMVEYILKFFMVADGVISENVRVEKENIQIPEIKQYYSLKDTVEAGHQEAYAHAINSYFPNTSDQDAMIEEIENSEFLKKKIEMTVKYTQEGNLGTRLFSTSVIEGLSFQQLFMIVKWFETTGRLPGLAFLNEQISKDEYDHHFHTTLFWDLVKHKPTQEQAHSIVRDIVEGEIIFAKFLIRNDKPNLTLKMSIDFIYYWADKCLKAFNYAPIYGITSPIDYMAKFGASSRAGFFEKQVGDYHLYVPTKPVFIECVEENGKKVIKVGGLTYNDI